MADAKKCPECKAGAPAWGVTFGDLMSLLMTFFVLLLSFATMEKPKPVSYTHLTLPTIYSV